MKLVRGRIYETCKSKEIKKEHKEEAKVDVETVAEEQEARVFLVTLVNNILHLCFSNVEMYINNQQIYNSKGLIAHSSYFFNIFKGAFSEYKSIL